MFQWHAFMSHNELSYFEKQEVPWPESCSEGNHTSFQKYQAVMMSKCLFYQDRCHVFKVILFISLQLTFSGHYHPQAIQMVLSLIQKRMNPLWRLLGHTCSLCMSFFSGKL
jgi:hypothetical protein